MVVLETQLSVLNKLVRKNFSVEELDKILFNLGFGVEESKGDDLKVEITAERPDLLSTQGLARTLKAYLGLDIGYYKIQKSNNKMFIKNAAKEWPHAVAAVVKGLKFDDDKIKEVIRIQEKLGVTFLRNRKKGGLGLYPLEKIKFPVTFTAEDPRKIHYRPLEYPVKISALEVLEKHPTGKIYKHLVQGWKKFPIFKDANGTIMSMPPIINSHDVGKIDETTTEVFVEATGTNLKTINLALEILVGALIDMGGKAYALEVSYGNKTILSPSFKEEVRKIKVDLVNKVLGSNFKANEIKKLLEKMMYKVKFLNSKELTIIVPSTRSDIWHDVDVIDDIARAYGFNNFKPTLRYVDTIGGTTPSVKIKEEISNLMIGLGYQETFTLVLTSKQDQFKKMKIKELKHMDLGKSIEQSINMTRVWLIPELMKCLQHNRSVEYPHKLFEISQVIIPDEKIDVKCKDVLRFGMVSCHSSASFTEAKQVLDFLAITLNFEYKIKETEHNSFIKGRIGRVSVNKKDVAYIGEINPEVLENFGLEMPVAALEINLTELFRLIQR